MKGPVQRTDRKEKTSGFFLQLTVPLRLSLIPAIIALELASGGVIGSLQAQPAETQSQTGNTKIIEASEKDGNIPIDVEWSRVSGAVRYRLEIRNRDGKPVVEQETSDNRITVSLPPGEYEKRLGLINKFNKLYLWTDWNPLRIIRIEQPRIELASPINPIPRGRGRQTIQLKTTGEMPQTRYYLVDSEGRERSVKVRRQADEVFLDIDPDSLPPGEYDLVMENPAGKRDIKKDLVIIEPSAEEKARLRRNRLRYAMLVPGIPQLERGQKQKGYSLMAAFYGSLAFTAYSYHRANTAYNRLQSDPLYGLFKDEATAQALSNQPGSNPLLYAFALSSYDRWQTDISTYNRYRVYYYAGATLTAGLYAYHLLDVYRFDIAMTRTAWGEPAIHTGLTWNF
jgi:hypothetical protein